MTITWKAWDKDFIESRYKELSGDGIAPAGVSAQTICSEMNGKYSYDSIENLIYSIRRRFPVPQQYRADLESGKIEKAKDGEHCAHCSMPLYYRMQEDGKHIHSWFCPWCHSQEYVMTLRIKTNRKPVGEQNYLAMEECDKV